MLRYNKAMEETIFTKIVKGEIPSHKVYEDADTLAFLDIHPVTAGHTLVIPKAQVEFIWDLPDQDYQAVMATVKKVGMHLREVLEVPFVAIRVVGVDVPHAHVQLIPFSDDAHLDFKPSMDAEPDHAALAELAQKLFLKDEPL
jgi:histidine triad (HIT) family protein